MGDNGFGVCSVFLFIAISSYFGLGRLFFNQGERDRLRGSCQLN